MVGWPPGRRRSPSCWGGSPRRWSGTAASGLHVYPEFHRRTPTRITGYRGTFSTTIVVADFDALSELIMGLSGLPDSQLDGPWWSLRRDNAMFREVRLAAIADARRRADDYAAAFGATVAELVEVSDLDGGFGGGRHADVAQDGDGGRPPTRPSPSSRRSRRCRGR